jgi:hypothetical protein
VLGHVRCARVKARLNCRSRCDQECSLTRAPRRRPPTGPWSERGRRSRPGLTGFPPPTTSTGLAAFDPPTPVRPRGKAVER